MNNIKNKAERTDRWEQPVEAKGAASKSVACKSAACKAYEAPVLVHYGDVRDVTLGPTVGIGESGNELGRRNPP